MEALDQYNDQLVSANIDNAMYVPLCYSHCFQFFLVALLDDLLRQILYVNVSDCVL